MKATISALSGWLPRAPPRGRAIGIQDYVTNCQSNHIKHGSTPGRLIAKNYLEINSRVILLVSRRFSTCDGSVADGCGPPNHTKFTLHTYDHGIHDHRISNASEDRQRRTRLKRVGGQYKRSTDRSFLGMSGSAFVAQYQMNETWTLRCAHHC